MLKQNRKLTKKGFSLIEIILAIVVIAGLIAIFYPRARSFQRSAQMTSVIETDVENIVQAATRWRTEDSSSNNTFSEINASDLCSYLPNNMGCDNNYIYSAGFKDNNNLGMIKYKILSDKINNDGDSFKIFMDASTLVNKQNWTNRDKTKIEKTFENIAKRASSDSSVSETDNLATDIGNANAGFDDTSGTTTDGKAGVRKISE